MSTRFHLPVLAALCCTHAACVAGAPPPAAPAATVAEGWQLSVSQEGGIAGMARRYTATGASDTLLVVDARRRTESAIALTSAEKQELARLVAARAGAPDADLRSPSCRDCVLFEMTLATGPADKPRRVRYDSTRMDDSPDAKLIERVISIGRNGMVQATP